MTHYFVKIRGIKAKNRSKTFIYTWKLKAATMMMWLCVPIENPFPPHAHHTESR